MNALLSYFVRLCLLRSTPQQLPASPALFWVTLIASLIAVLLLAGERANLFMALLAGISDTSLMLLLLWLALLWQGHKGRFLQSATAFLGASTLLGLVAIPLEAVLGVQGNSAVISQLVWMAWFAWNMLVLGYILRHTFDISLALGVALALSYTLVAYQLMSPLFAMV